ncbi:putative myb-like dna-binding [Diaporthe ampelina]|uniref:Putative myb-like dna-binding n=1 Tax=Diaporthe ampelina TaxID=1214573 RepID=A0A0G2FF93_9PEZI|nr:putative myb-like dna-binding [Diaporthe ampelina]
MRAPWKFPDLKTGVSETSDRASVASAISPTAVKTTSPTVSRPSDQQDDDAATAQEDGEIIEDQPPRKKSRLHISSKSFELPPKVTEIPMVDQSSDSDDEDMNDYFDSEIAKAESELQRLEHVNNAVPTEIVIRYAQVTHEALVAVATENGSLKDMLGPIPEDVVLPTQKDNAVPEPEKSTPAEPVKAETDQVPAQEDAYQATESTVPTEIERPEVQEENGDVAMEDAPMNGLDTTMSEAVPLVPNGVPAHVGDQPLLLPPGVAPPVTADSSPTPVEEEEDETDIEVDDVTLELVRPSMQTPPVEDLPCFNAKPWMKSRQAMSSMEHDTEVEVFISRILQDNSMFVRNEQQAKRLEYAGNYEEYLRFTISDDPVASKSRDAFNKANAPVDGGGSQVAGPEPKPEGRRGGRFATDRDIERIMAQSLLEAREKEERETRAEKLKHPSTSEAVIPEMYWTKEDRDKELFIDHSGFLNPEKLIANWQVLPPAANFTEQEAQLFEKAYLEFPKQWGRIADQIPGRDFHSCIQYYYLKKKELNLKEKLKRQPKKKKSRKTKARSSALVSELGNPDEPQDENAETGENGERRRPRRAAAPTWDFEKPHPESAEGTPAATPSRRGAGAKAESGTEKADKPRRKRVAKEKEPKQPKTPQVLAPTPQGVAKGARSRSSSKVPVPEFLPSQTPTAEMGRTPLSFDVGRASPMPGLPPSIVPAPGNVMSPAEKALSANANASSNANSNPNAAALLDIMAPPTLRPEPIPPPQSQVATFEFTGHVGSTPHVAAEPPERVGRATPSNANAASSYWSVAEMNNFPELLRSFGTDWQAIAQHMTTKTATMVQVKNFYNKQTGREKPEWGQIASEADQKRQSLKP